MGRSSSKSWIKAKKITIDGIEFASLAEGARYQELKLRLAAGELHSLRCHTTYPLVINGKTIGRYTDDFNYHLRGDKILTVEDVKGWITPRDRIRLKVFAACYPEVRLVIVQKERKRKSRARLPKKVIRK